MAKFNLENEQKVTNENLQKISNNSTTTAKTNQVSEQEHTYLRGPSLKSSYYPSHPSLDTSP